MFSNVKKYMIHENIYIYIYILLFYRGHTVVVMTVQQDKLNWIWKLSFNVLELIGTSPDRCLNWGWGAQLKLMNVVVGNSNSLQGSKEDFYEAPISRIVFLVEFLILLEIKISNAKLPYIKLYLIYLRQDFFFILTNLNFQWLHQAQQMLF